MPDHPYLVKPGSRPVLADIDTNDDSLFPVGKIEGKSLLKDLASELGELQELIYAGGRHKILVILQAMDTGGKDGTIKGAFSEMDAMGIRVMPFKRPTENELARDYLWRVHREVPRKGEVVVFNRSHYEDIIAVRVRQIAPQAVWSRRYEHIVNFEKMLADEGTTIVKIFLHISKDEQKARLQARLDEPHKHWKFNPGDLEDRKLWPAFQKAYQDVIRKTSTPHAPWYIVPADRKWHRNLAVAQIMVNTLRSLNMTYPKVTFDPSEIVVE